MKQFSSMRQFSLMIRWTPQREAGRLGEDGLFAYYRRAAALGRFLLRLGPPFMSCVERSYDILITLQDLGVPEFLRCRHQTIFDSPGVKRQIDIPDSGIGGKLLKLGGDTFEGGFFCLIGTERVGVQA